MIQPLDEQWIFSSIIGRSQPRVVLKKGQDDREEMLGILYSRYIDTLQSNNCDETEEQGITRVENVALHHAKG